jgi:peptidoglycan/LPS O-acetylase OafA/YrhL
MRIAGIILVVLQHISTASFLSWNLDKYHFLFNPLPTIYIDYRFFGIFLFIFASGCSLAVSDNPKTLSDAIKFYKKRILRIYPIFWIALFFGAILMPWTLQNLKTPFDYVRMISGFQIFFQTTAQATWGINVALWFIGLIISLYLLFPLMSVLIHKHPHVSIVSTLLVSIVSRVVMFYIFPQFISGYDWFPLCRLFEFSLGIYIIQMGLYPRFVSNNVVAFFGKLSFYVYLVQVPIMYITNYQNVGIALFISATLVFATMFYTFDNALHRIKKKD